MPKSKLILILGYSGVGLFSLLILAMLFPMTRRESFAACTPDSSTDECMAMPMSTEVGVTTKTVISLALDNQVQMEVIPKSNGATSYASTRLAVSTNSNDGYAIYMQTGSETGNLTGVTSNLEGEISNTVKQDVVLDSLETNAYGYALSKTAVSDSTTYSHVPTTSTVIESTTSSAVSGGEYAYGDIYYLAFGAKVGTSLPAGQYAGTVTVSAVANPTTLRSMYDLTYMQDMTSDICENTKEHYTKQLIDSRDGKSYWVAKLKDGNCWMTQNLALDLDTNEAGNAVAVSENGSKVELNSGNTDISDVWSEYTPEKTETEIPKALANDPVSTKSWDFGEVVLTNPTKSSYCGGVGVGISFGGKITDCEWYQGVAGWKPVFESTATSSLDMDNQIYDAHYLVGNYYQYNTVTAGTGELTNGANSNNVAANTDPTKLVDATGSICPSGWKLPVAGKNNTTGLPFDREDSFYRLLLAYGYPMADDWNPNDGNANTTIVGPGKVRFDYAPIYFMRNGSVGNGKMSDTGGNGSYRSATARADSTAYAYGLYFSTAYVYSSGIYLRYTGYNARCHAK